MPPVGVDVRAEEADALGLDRALHRRHERIQRRRRVIGAAFGDQRVGAGEAQEGDRHDAMPGRLRASQHVRAHLRGEREVRRQRVSLRGPNRFQLPDDRRPRPEQAASDARGAEALLGQDGRRGGTDHDLARTRFLLGLHDRGRGRFGDQELAMRLADREQQVIGTVHPDRHSEVEPWRCRCRSSRSRAARRTWRRRSSTRARRACRRRIGAGAHHRRTSTARRRWRKRRPAGARSSARSHRRAARPLPGRRAAPGAPRAS